MLEDTIELCLLMTFGMVTHGQNSSGGIPKFDTLNLFYLILKRVALS